MKLHSIIIDEDKYFDARVYYEIHIWPGIFAYDGWLSDEDLAGFAPQFRKYKRDDEPQWTTGGENWRGDEHPDQNAEQNKEVPAWMWFPREIPPEFIELIQKLPDEAWVDVIDSHLIFADEQNLKVDVHFKNLEIVDLEENKATAPGLIKVSCLMDVNLAQFLEYRAYMSEYDSPEDLATDGTGMDGFRVIRTL